LLDGDAGFEPRDTLVLEICEELYVPFEPLRKNQLGIALKAECVRHDADHRAWP
jgi:hypothetical protein